MNSHKLLIGLSAFLGAGAMLLIPELIDDEYVYHLLVMANIYVLLAVSLNLLIGYTGLFSLGHAAFYGIGAYTSALLATKLGVPFALALPASGVVTAIFGVAVGFPALRLQGIFLAIGTLGFNEIIRLVMINTDSIGGSSGIAGIPKPSLFGYSIASSETYYLFSSLLVIFVLIVLRRLLNGRPGRALIAIRDNEMAAKAMGINVTRYKIAIFGISSFLAGVSGSLFAYYITYVSPDNFTTAESFAIVAMVALGGMGNLFGSVVGAVVLSIIPEMFRFLGEFRSIIYGLTLILIMYLLPQGILGWCPAVIKKLARADTHVRFAESAGEVKSNGADSGK
ncbi:hypothetical protein AXX12_14910 [Anaerosporomusa subterranea]|uniref:Branched-chain amino acid ABC transporter permease n=1 Tax=Anaerosporomusa subterranea TaxID=1794912 RepID=A0A154BM02_ANASB|nr:branched-chain amino acid ABC transporter permease [Anaerosporomusa subterranea]KYZ74870.1 hypothetical protein AXX12_14910 [Anaerosporomusa subterranea]